MTNDDAVVPVAEERRLLTQMFEIVRYDLPYPDGFIPTIDEAIEPQDD